MKNTIKKTKEKTLFYSKGVRRVLLAARNIKLMDEYHEVMNSGVPSRVSIY